MFECGRILTRFEIRKFFPLDVLCSVYSKVCLLGVENSEESSEEEEEVEEVDPFEEALAQLQAQAVEKSKEKEASQEADEAAKKNKKKTSELSSPPENSEARSEIGGGNSSKDRELGSINSNVSKTRLGVDKVKPKGWFKYFLYVD